MIKICLLQLQHGSGKTAVLVERIIRKIINDNIDIDRLLVVTFTNAAASQMREKILQAIYQKLEKNAGNAHLQRQIVLMNKANISTIHAFCLDVIRNHFYEIGISPNFRMGDTGELELLRQETIDDLFEEKYESKDPNFAKLIECYTSYRGDDDLKELVFKIDRFIMCMPFPEKWLNNAVERFDLKNNKEDFGKTVWGEILLENIREKASGYCLELSILEKRLKKEGLDSFAQTVLEDIDVISKFKEIDNWDEAHKRANTIEFPKWPVDRKLVSNIKDEAKEKRTNIKESFTDSIELIKLYDSYEALSDISYMEPILKSLKDIVIAFEEKYSKAKRERNIIDFNDIEHFALQILEKPEIAQEYRDKFIEIAIDEYQDSNLIQDYILNTISRGNNTFMVGDVKQSIYKFRNACPKLFLDKYETYGVSDDNGIIVQLFKNFRSRKEILDITNETFKAIMSKKLGDIEYTEKEYLNLGAKYETDETGSKRVELHIIDTENTQDMEMLDKPELEAKFVAKRIHELQKNDGKIKYKDIVILLRAPNEVGAIYEKELLSQGIPVYSDTANVYLDSAEITTVLSLLKVVDNPNQDIPLVTILRSPIFNFNDNELIQIKLNDKQGSFYDAIKKSSEVAQEPLKSKVNDFLNSISTYREKQEYLPLNELIWYIYEQTGYMSYIKLTPNGAIKQANLKMLFELAKDYESASFKGLYNFIHYIERMKKIGQDFGGAKIIGENENVVRIMSIHKSKGLEFPVVFICGMGKGFNFRDLNEKVLFHQDIGFGPKYINYSRQIEYDTLAKEAVKEITKKEAISEEMRVLYVGLTRAKEKLVLIGVQKGAEEKVKEKTDILENCNEEKLPMETVRKYKTYLDWLELVYIRNGLEYSIHSQKEIEDIEKEERQEKPECKEISKEEKSKLKEYLEWEYKYNGLSQIPSKSSVTSIKQRSQNKAVECKLEMPEFMQETKALTGAQKGTVIHFVLQKLNLSKNYTSQELMNFLDELVSKRLLTEKEKESINIQQIQKFMESDLAKDIKDAKKVYKEKSFYLYLPAKDIYGGEVEEKVIVQGIIDLYYIDKNGEMVLVDYKTDYAKDERELIDKYYSQVQIYKKALEQGTSEKVKRIYIYSLYLDKAILVT